MRPSLALAALLAPLPALAEPPAIVTDIAPVHSLVSQVMAGVGEPALLLDQSDNPHSVNLRPSQARMLEQADLVVWVGAELEPWLERALDGLSHAETLELIDLPVTTLRNFDTPHDHDHDEDDHAGDHDDHDHDEHDHDGHDHGEHEHEHEHDDHAEAGDDHGHVHTGVDPHAWLSPDNGRAWLGAIAAELAARDPENAATYEANAKAAIAEIDALDARITAQLAPFEGGEIVTFHDALRYFSDAYPIDVLGSVKPGDASTPSAAALAELRDLVADHGVVCVFGEPGVDTGLLDAITSETGLGTGVLDVTGATLTPGPDLYGAVLGGLADEIAACLGRS